MTRGFLILYVHFLCALKGVDLLSESINGDLVLIENDVACRIVAIENQNKDA
jgi:hypothetical protein